jgi:DNA anti-recombination protein RmuC
MSRKQKPPVEPEPKVESTDDVMAGGNLDQIRDILFGAQAKEFERRFSGLESSLQAELRQIRDDFKNQTEMLESYFKGELKEVSSKQRKEQSKRESEVDRLDTRAADHKRNFDQKLDDLEESFEERISEVRENLLRQGQQLSDSLQKGLDTLRSDVDERMNQIGVSKADRLALAGMFSEMSMRLKNELDLSGLTDQ